MRLDRCRFCNRRKCRVRIYTEDYGFDELACDEHIHELEVLADKTLGKNNGVLRTHVTSSKQLLRAKV